MTDDSERKSYFFTHNSRGDIIGIYSGSGALTAKYEYDAWGNVLSVTDANGNTITSETHIGNLNPFRYRGYYYDSETGLYYLISRYYDPVTRRFINADSLISTGQGIMGYNMFSYCGNNPVIRIDYSGELWQIAALLIAGVVIACTFTSSENQGPKYRQQAKDKYNNSTVKVYERDNPPDEKGVVNAEIYYPDDSVSNISIDNSLSVTSRYEQDAILDVIIESPYYSEATYGSKSFMRAQWVAHNACYNIASSGDFGFWIMQRFSGSDNPIQSSNSLDLRSLNNMLKRQELLYTIISWVY